MSTEPQVYDAVVIGAGAGGLFAAARLAKAGYRTLVIERLDKVGGRASTDEMDGFRVNNGAIVIEVGGITEQTCREVGADFDIREPHPSILYRIAGKDVDIARGGWGFLLAKLTRQGAKLAKGLGAARDDSGLPEGQMSTAEWVAKYTKNEGVHGIFRNMCASVFSVGSDELPARVFLTYFTRKSAFKRFGFHPEGTIGLWRALADAVDRLGGDVRLSSSVRQILVEDGQVRGVIIDSQVGSETVECPIVISDIGPMATTLLLDIAHLPADYLAEVKRTDRPTSMITVNFASKERLIDAPGMLSFSKTRRLAYMASFCELCPEMAPPGWWLYVGTAVPEPAIGNFDETAETELLMADLREQIDRFDERARVLSVVITRDEWPPQRAVVGSDLTHETPICGLWNVGDGVKEFANGGTTACAETAQIVVEKVVREFPR